MHTVIVAKDKSGEYETISEAVKNLGSNGVKIFIKQGVYKEKIVIDKPNVFFEGENKDNVIITYSDAAFAPDETGNPMGTFKTATFHIMPSAYNFKAKNITFRNDSGMGDIVGQAVAVYADCDKAVFENCNFFARQDTLLTAPMHEDIAKNPDILNRQYFKNCYIEGDVDFIFGGAVVVFENCEIFSCDRNRDINGYITAACTSPKMKFGFVFINCILKSNAAKNTVYLGRPWRENAKTVFINCTLGEHIKDECWSVWGDTDRHKTCYYAQYNSSGPGYNESKVINWSNILKYDDVKSYTLENIFDGWNPLR